MSKNNKASTYNEKMLTRLRIQFIVLSMAVVIIMQGFIVYTSVRNTYNKMVAKSDHLVSSIYINILDKKPIKADARYFYITFGKDNPAPEPLISITYLIFLKMRLWQYIMRHMRQENLMDFTMVTDIAYMKKRNVQLLYSYFEVI